MHQDLTALLDVIVGHFASRRDALNAIAQLGNRFEDWVKWEAIVAIHNSLLVTPKPWYSCAGVEHTTAYADLFVGYNEWSYRPSDQDYDWPEPHERDVWIELKVRTTRDAGGQDLANALAGDRAKLRAKRGRARGLVAVLLLEHPGWTSVQQFFDEFEQSFDKADYLRTIHDHSLNAASHKLDKKVVVVPKPLAIVAAWLV